MGVFDLPAKACATNTKRFNSLSPKLNSVDFRVAGLAILWCK